MERWVEEGDLVVGKKLKEWKYTMVGVRWGSAGGGLLTHWL